MKLNHPLTFSWKSLNRQGHSHGCPLSGIGEKLSTHPTDRKWCYNISLSRTVTNHAIKWGWTYKTTALEETVHSVK